MTKLNLKQMREEMVEQQIHGRGITAKNILKSMLTVPRHLFVSEEQQSYAYLDGPLQIGYGQTISQPYIVAFMTEALKLKKTHRVLEVGTGCGYQAAVLSLLVNSVVSLEIVPELASSAKKRLKQLGYENVEVHRTDGYRGWLAAAPYDRIIVTAAPATVPESLLDQLAPDGRTILPVGDNLFSQYLQIITKDDKGYIHSERSLAVRFVPLVKDVKHKT